MGISAFERPCCCAAGIGSKHRTYLGRDDVLIAQRDEAEDAFVYPLVHAAAPLGVNNVHHVLQPVRNWQEFCVTRRALKRVIRRHPPLRLLTANGPPSRQDPLRCLG